MSKTRINNKITSVIVAVSILMSIIIPMSSVNAESFCRGCGTSIDSYYAEKLKEEYNIYLINYGQSDVDSKSNELYFKYIFEDNHIDPSTGKACTNHTNTANWSVKGYKGYFDTTPFPTISLTSSKITYTGGNVEPSFKVTFNGKEIAKSNYDYYYTYKTADSAPRAYSYCSSVSKNIKEPGTYYLYVLFNPSNTCGPEGTCFLGRIEAQFEIVNGSVPDDNPGKGEDSGNSGADHKNSALVEEDGKIYYIDENGQRVKDSVQKIGDVYYYFGSDGAREYPNNEYRKGVWFTNGIGADSYSGGHWCSDSKGWWFEDNGYFPTSSWLKIDGYWYYFCADGYMDYSEYRDGCWLNSDGSWNIAYSGGHWCSDSSGWWYEDTGWYPSNQYLWIDGIQYWFGADGYWQ
ncbi:MAG: hypothetical protein K5865_04905 [Eubacterium sp.]|nr:hypothetical protein [Eubacterium sp.]